MPFRFDNYDPDPTWLRIVRAKKYRRCCAFFCLALPFAILFVALIVFTVFEKQHNYLLTDNFLTKNDDMAILSATYYPKSKSFPDNTVVLLMNSHLYIHVKYPYLQIVSSNSTYELVTTLRVEQVLPQWDYYCHWVPYIAIGQVVGNMKWLEISNDPRSRENGAAIKFRRPYNEKHDVVSCFTPMFMHDRWQGLLVATEVYSHYGAFMHFYVRSMITPVFKMLQKYPNTRISHWPAVKLGAQRAREAEFDPNTELEFRNQAAAMTDCLLLYKDAADYIIFPDPDEVIIPRFAPDYHGEFLKAFHTYPDAGVIAYNMTQTKFMSAILPRTFRPTDVLESIQFTGEHRWGKLVVKPSRVDSIWIHRSYGIREGFEQVEMPIVENSMVHIRFNRDQEEAVNVTHTAKYNPFLNDTRLELIPRKDLDQIKKNFENRIQEHNETYYNLPSQLVYHPLVDRCYRDGFYNGESHSVCKGPEMCKIPAFPGIHCVNTESKYETYSGYSSFSLTGSWQLYIHILDDFKFEESWNGCKL